MFIIHPFNNIEVLISYCVLDNFLGKSLKLLIYLYSLIDKYYFCGQRKLIMPILIVSCLSNRVTPKLFIGK